MGDVDTVFVLAAAYDTRYAPCRRSWWPRRWLSPFKKGEAGPLTPKEATAPSRTR